MDENENKEEIDDKYSMVQYNKQDKKREIAIAFHTDYIKKCPTEPVNQKTEVW